MRCFASLLGCENYFKACYHQNYDTSLTINRKGNEKKRGIIV